MYNRLDLWPTDLNMNRDHLLIKDYPLTKFGASGAKRSWVISCTRLRDIDVPTDIPTYRPTCATQYAPPSSKGRGHNKTVYKHEVHLRGRARAVRKVGRGSQNKQFLPSLGFEPGTFLLRDERAKYCATRCGSYRSLKSLPRFTWVCHLVRALNSSSKPMQMKSTMT